MKTYPIWCHVCGATFDYETEFLGGGDSLKIDGKTYVVGTCNMRSAKLGQPPAHHPALLQRSFNQMTIGGGYLAHLHPATLARFLREHTDGCEVRP